MDDGQQQRQWQRPSPLLPTSSSNTRIKHLPGGTVLVGFGELIAHARKLATQARDAHYQHSEIGYYNYRLSHVLAGIGRVSFRCHRAVFKTAPFCVL